MKQQDPEKFEEELARERWVGKISLFLFVILMGLVFIVFSFKERDRFAFVIGFLVTMTMIFVYMLTNLDKPDFWDPERVQIILFVGLVITIVLGFLVQTILFRLGLWSI